MTWELPPRCGEPSAPGTFFPTAPGPVVEGFTLLAASELDGGVEGAPFTLSWVSLGPEVEVAVEESTRETWSGAVTLFAGVPLVEEGGRSIVVVPGRPPGRWSYRVRAARGGIVGPWSSPRSIVVSAGARAILHETRRGVVHEPSLRAHRAFLRMAAARGDLLVILAMPEHYRDDEAIAHAAQVRAVAGPGGRDALPAECLSFGALVHPWVATTNGRGAAQRSTADGALVGALASLATVRGPWVSAAGRPLADVVALSPALLRERAAELAEARVNVVAQGTRGFAPLGVETLSDDPDLVESSVRRLLIFLRRIALDRGASWVFEPHDATLRRTVDAAFNGLLGDLFQRGAFAGKDAASAYRVVTDVAVNPPPSVDAGRLVVELRVAPSVPLRFLTIRLVQQGARAAVAEVR